MKTKILFFLIILLILTGAMFAFLRMNRSPVWASQNQRTAPLIVTKINCSGTPTVSETEGPYYKIGSPEQSNLYNLSIIGTKFVLTGYVVDTHCKPIAHAWLDFWQADGNGHYDNAGYTLRGHQYTDGNGRFTLVTVIPGEYPGRTPHIHVKVRAGDKTEILTTQLFIPGLASNTGDSIYNPTLQMQNVKKTSNGKSTTFLFILRR